MDSGAEFSALTCSFTGSPVGASALSASAGADLVRRPRLAPALRDPPVGRRAGLDLDLDAALDPALDLPAFVTSGLMYQYQIARYLAKSKAI
jgi:hypothetical protein